jgi:hypothetical protein
MKKHIKRLDPSVLGILSRVQISGPPWKGFITDGQLDRDSYVRLNEALVALGGKWNRSAKAHLFYDDPRQKLEQLIITGVFATHRVGDFFQTPREIADDMAVWVVRQPGKYYEPSAGHGRLAIAARERGAIVECGELFEERCGVLRGLGFQATSGDFLQINPRADYDGVIMNPPFSGGAECLHILHALRFVRPGGRLISVMSAAINYREDKLYTSTRDKLKALGAYILDLPDGSFSEEGTEWPTVLVKVQL